MKVLIDTQDKAHIPAGLNTFIGKSEIPEQLQKWRDQLKDNQNPGLVLRWSAALTEIELTMMIPSEAQQQATAIWRKNVIDLVDE